MGLRRYRAIPRLGKKKRNRFSFLFLVFTTSAATCLFMHGYFLLESSFSFNIIDGPIDLSELHERDFVTPNDILKMAALAVVVRNPQTKAQCFQDLLSSVRRHAPYMITYLGDQSFMPSPSDGDRGDVYIKMSHQPVGEIHNHLVAAVHAAGKLFCGVL